MNRLRVRAIFRKDMRDAVRDSRVLTALLMPLALGLFYSFMFNDDSIRTQKVKIGVVASEKTALMQAIKRQAGADVRLVFVAVPDQAQLRQRVRAKKVDIGLVVPPGFDAGVKAGSSPSLELLLPASPSVSPDFVTAIVDRSVRDMAGQAPPARIVRRSLPADQDATSALDVLGPRKDFILVAMIMLLAMIAVYAVPAVLVEETEKKTMEALTLIASTAEVITAKALFGIALSVVGVPVLLVITRGDPGNVALLAAAVVLSAVVLVGIGLLASGFFRTQQQLNTWSGLVLLVLLAPAFTIGIPTPDVVNKILWFLPTGHSFRLIADAFADTAIYPHRLLSACILVVWAAVAYGLLWWRLSRQEAV